MTTSRTIKALVELVNPAKRGLAAASGAGAEYQSESESELEPEQEEYRPIKHLKKVNPYRKKKKLGIEAHRILREANAVESVLLQATGYAIAIQNTEKRVKQMYQFIQGTSPYISNRNQAVAQIKKYDEELTEISKTAAHRVHYLQDNQASGLQ